MLGVAHVKWAECDGRKFAGPTGFAGLQRSWGQAEAKPWQVGSKAETLQDSVNTAGFGPRWNSTLEGAGSQPRAPLPRTKF